MAGAGLPHEQNAKRRFPAGPGEEKGDTAFTSRRASHALTPRFRHGYGKVKLAHLRRRPQISATFKPGWRWATVEGAAELIGPDDPNEHVDADRLRLLLREIFVAAGGAHDDWETYDSVMAGQRRTAVFIEPSRIYGS